MLGYPVPTLIAWGQEGKEAKAGGWVMSGGSHMAKISATLNYLNGLDPAQDNDLVIMIDAYDVWFQLPKSVLMERYHMINEQANKRIIKQIGRDAMQRENVTQSIIFGSGKRCAPNQLHTIACYPIPASPLPDDLYYDNTDTDIGPNEFASRRQRWLNSGVILGPVGKLRELFSYAEEMAKGHPAHDPEDNGSHGSDNMYHRSDQSIFATIRGHKNINERSYTGDTTRMVLQATNRLRMWIILPLRLARTRRHPGDCLDVAVATSMSFVTTD